MRKVLVFQHVANKILGTLNPTLKARGLNIRYVNYERTPDEHPSMQKYNGLIVLGGHMSVYEADKYKHIRVEMRLIEEALKKNIPVLGICLGAQLLAHVLGSDVRKNAEKEIGWYDLKLTDKGVQDPLFSHFKPVEKVFQLHGDTFDIPSSCSHLATTNACPSQAFKYGEKVYGLQFHLEADEAMITRWLDNPRNQEEMFSTHKDFSMEQMRLDTQINISNSLELSKKTFEKFIDLFALKERPLRLGTDHAKPHKNLK